MDSTVAGATDRTAQQLVSSTVEWLQSQHSVLAGDDSGLGNLWLEFCAQVQGQQSVYWDEYETVVRDTVDRLVCELSVAERQALWLQTEAGNDWLDEDNVDASQAPVFLEDVIDDIYSKVWQRAADWEDRRLERYLALSSGDEYYEDDEDSEEDFEEDGDEEEEADQDGEDAEESVKWVISPRDQIEETLARQADPAEVDAREAQFAYGVGDCGICGTELSQFGLMVDGRLKGSPIWGNLCSHCFTVRGEGIGNGVGQLYARQPDGRWRLVAGFPR